MTTTFDLGQKLWGLCDVLRDDGITYHEYVTELTYLLFLKMAQETGTEQVIPAGYRWADLLNKDGIEQLNFYRQQLVYLGTSAEAANQVRSIFADANTALREPRILKKLVSSIDELDWYSAKRENLGDLYEDLLERNASEKKSGAGQYFTPRPLINCMVNLIKPKPGERIQDPALGTGGFLIAADRYIKANHDSFNMTEQQYEFQHKEAFYGMELVPDTHRLALMNAMLHDIAGDWRLGDTLSPDGGSLPKADVILTNPPFGTKKGGGLPSREDFTFSTSNKQLAFLQHIYRGLKPGGRAAVVLPDNVLFEDNVGVKIRTDLMDKCNLHTILRLPTGIFYAQGVKTNVLFFTRGTSDKGNTKAVWVYDMRANMPSFGKRTPFTSEYFKDFELAFGDDPLGQSVRHDQGEESRFRCFSRDQIRARNENLDISWLRDENASDGDNLPDPDEIAAEIMENLRNAMDEMEELVLSLQGEKL